jgi:hypothetical protein
MSLTDLDDVVDTPWRCPEALRDCYSEDGSPDLCPNCRSGLGFIEVVTDRIDNVACEKEFYCFFCHETVAHWAYGSFEPII